MPWLNAWRGRRNAMAEIKRAHQWAVKRSEQGKRQVCATCGALKTPSVNPVCWTETVEEPAIIVPGEEPAG